MTAAESKYIESLVKQEEGRLLGFIRKRVDREEDVRDIAQDVYFQLTVGFNDIRSLTSVTAWLFSVARNRITDLYRKKRPERLYEQVVARMDGEEDPLMLEDILPSLSPGPEEEFTREALWETIGACLDRLPAPQREVFVMNEFEDLSFKEISELTGEGINTLLSRKRYAVTYLREQLSTLYDEIKGT
jgi:RNA polymerase sigma factor (sigma-70 family)